MEKVDIQIKHVLREGNQLADYLTNNVLNFAGNSAYNSIVDTNLNTLRQRIEVQRKKDKLINTIYRSENGWNYTWEYDDKRKKHSLALELVELAGLAGTNIGFVFLSGYFCMFLVSLMLHIAIA
ncbi:hypothetical protein HAX54_031187 [Datura stramonium]|uniref:RNase H type-1 domain-containing protein n=1 Tax=Datura stramonium TaxID=4076 RepID=A0ABS8VBM8_DATST|nr:hypothetical protein [Datura stramonium]